MAIVFPTIPEYQADPLLFANYRDMMAQPELSVLQGGLLSPTEQRLRMVADFTSGIHNDERSAVQATGELNLHFGLEPRIGEVAKEGYLRVVDELLVDPDDGITFALNSAKAAVSYMNELGKLDSLYRSFGGRALTRRDVPGFSQRPTSFKGGKPKVTFSDATFTNSLHFAIRADAPNAKWQRSVDRAVEFLDGIFVKAFEPSAAKGIVSLGLALGDVARGSAQKAIESSQTRTFVMPPARERHPELATPKLAKPNVVAPTPEVNDSEATRLLEELGLQPLGSKALKDHPLFVALKKGASVTLGSVYSFGGFGDNAGFAAAFVDRMASIVEGNEPEAIETLARQLAEAKRLIGTRITSEAKHALSLFIDVATQCSQHNFCQVAKNYAPQVHPTTLRAVQCLTLLRERVTAV